MSPGLGGGAVGVGPLGGAGVAVLTPDPGPGGPVMAPYVRLEADGVESLTLDDVAGFVVESLDLGFPSIRAVVSPRPDADGEFDESRNIGGRAVTLNGNLVGVAGSDRQHVLDRLRTFLRPDLRPYIVFRLEPDGDERRIRLRGDQHAAPIVAPGDVDFSVSWRGPDGVQESVDVSTVRLSATTDVEAGRAYDLTFDRVYPASPPVGVSSVSNDGNVSAFPVLRLYGPCTGPNIENQTTGRGLFLPDLVVAAGDYVELDTRARTVRLLGLADQSRYSYVDFDVSAWWVLVPGDNSLRYFPSSFDSGAAADVIFRTNWL